jgi:hypothetical protein
MMKRMFGLEAAIKAAGNESQTNTVQKTNAFPDFIGWV